MQRQAMALVLAGMCLASCRSGARSGTENQANRAMATAVESKLSLTSSAFRNGRPIPQRFSCDGYNQSPPLQWGEPPEGTKSFALTIDDPDAPSGTFRHWAVFDIPPATRSMAAGDRIGVQGMNDKGMPGYTGPCPPQGNPPHHYHFRLFALSVEKLGLAPTAHVKEVEDAAEKHAIGQAELIGTYQRL